MKVYLNGKLDGIAGPYLTPGNYNYDMFIGKWTSSSSYLFNGLIDEVKIYNRALTDNEIKQDYNAGSAIQFGSTSQSIGGTTTSLEYCIPGDTSYCAPPIAEWKMDEGVGTSTVDTSGNNNTGTLGAGNSAPTWVQGKIGKAMSFDGNDYTYASLNGTNLSDFSYEFWFKTNTISGNAGIIQWANSLSSGSPMIYIDRISSSVRIYNSGTYSSTIPVTENTWYHFSAVYSSGTTTTDIYVNGVLKTKFVRELTSIYKSNGLILYTGNGYNGYFNGSIDHVKIYDYARTPAQIAYDYNRGGPIGWWKLDECQGNIAYDWSGIGNTGAINIGASGTQNSLGTCAVGTSAAWTNGITGKINSSINFDGTDDYITLPTFTYTSNASISVWVKGSYLNGNQIIIGSPNSISLGLYNSGSDKGLIGSANISKAVGIANNFVNDSWNHLVVTLDNPGNATYYCNGQPLTNNGTNNWSWSSGSYIGKRDSGNYFSGQIDDVRIYNYALTEEQIKQVYNGGAVNFR